MSPVSPPPLCHFISLCLLWVLFLKMWCFLLWFHIPPDRQIRIHVWRLGLGAATWLSADTLVWAPQATLGGRYCAKRWLAPILTSPWSEQLGSARHQKPRSPHTSRKLLYTSYRGSDFQSVLQITAQLKVELYLILLLCEKDPCISTWKFRTVFFFLEFAFLFIT